MARRKRYAGDPVLTAAEVAQWCREHIDDLQRSLVENIIVPGVTQMCEAETGAAIRTAEYVEDWPQDRLGNVLDVGQVRSISSVSLLRAGADPIPVEGFELEVDQRVGRIVFAGGRPSGRLHIEYVAGVDLDAYPSVRTWLLLQAGTLYQQREALVTGTIVSELPLKFLGSMLAEIAVPPRF